MSEADPYSPKQFLKKHLIKIIIILFVVILIFVTFYFYNQYQSTKSLLQGNGVNNSQDKAIISQVGKLMVLPSEDPRIFNVSDKTKLSNEPFFAQSENGDKLLIYSKAKEAILYRPSLNKIVQVSAINLDQNGTAQENSSSVTPTPKIISISIYNGTTVTGLAKSAGAKITSANPNYSVSTGDASSQDYKQTLIIDISGKNSQAADNMATLLGAKTQSTIPSGETKPNADILVILGIDYPGK